MAVLASLDGLPGPPAVGRLALLGRRHARGRALFTDRPLAILGAGASGLMATIWAAGEGLPVVLLDGTPEGGRKILLSGGGRCNILPASPAPERFVTESSPHTLRKILNSWPLREQRRFFEDVLGLPLMEEPDTGKIFPSCNDARRVRDLLVEEARRRGARMRFGVRVKELASERDIWRLPLEDGSSLEARAVILAPGGCSYPATGSDGWGFEAARRLGHRIHPTYPALTPLAAEPPLHAHLAGISLNVTLESPGAGTGKKIAARGGFLFTHRGYSGPAVLEISHAAVRSRMAGGPGRKILVKWTELDRAGWDRLLQEWRGGVEALVARHLPSRLAETLCREAGVEPDLKTAQLRRDLRLMLLSNLTRYPLPWTGDEGYAKAEVTGGGVDLGELDPRTMESRLHPGLFFCGEILDAFGPIGGYNFQWAWATGRAAGSGARER